MTDTREMNLYECECGATYWVAAPDLKSATLALFAQWDDEGSVDDSDDGFEIERVPQARAEKLRFNGSDGLPVCSMAEEAARQTRATVIACSEWP